MTTMHPFVFLALAAFDVGIWAHVVRLVLA